LATHLFQLQLGTTSGISSGQPGSVAKRSAPIVGLYALIEAMPGAPTFGENLEVHYSSVDIFRLLAAVTNMQLRSAI
jgi:hypothetical protein